MLHMQIRTTAVGVASKRTSADEIPLGSLIFGYGPMLPFVLGAVGVLALPSPWPLITLRLLIIWGASILIFVAGVRRGYGFGNPRASTGAEIAAMLLYFVPGGIALVLGQEGQIAKALELLIFGFALVILVDRRAAARGNAPRHFGRLRGPQMAIAIASLVVVLIGLPLT